MKKMNKKNHLKNEKGVAILESLAFIMLFMLLTAYVIDFFSAVHTGIVSSIAARTYLFETFQHRSDLSHLRFTDDNPNATPDTRNNFVGVHERFHAVSDEEQGVQDDSKIAASGRAITIPFFDANSDVPAVTSNKEHALDDPTYKTTLVWIKTGYGICVDSHCPDGG